MYHMNICVYNDLTAAGLPNCSCATMFVRIPPCKASNYVLFKVVVTGFQHYEAVLFSTYPMHWSSADTP